ncbi:hypothetical protein GWK47_036523 [Chionoecetes opilio]|uniref:Uncharacterized protein n=1 Tax=Chionoecetes opilio TaxID=41210 RepID=A0A8J5D2N1_CHIOP|nr:hypothetical protein GWK47_036523 [Chionoecetes opilio]
MEGKKQRLSPAPEGWCQPPLLDDPQKAALLAAHYQDKIGLRSPLASSLTINAAINTAVASPGIPALTSPFTTDEMDRALSTLNQGKLRGRDNVPYEFLLHMTPPLKGHGTLPLQHQLASGRLSYVLEILPLLPIPKPGKDPTLPSTYALSLSPSCVGKLPERLVATRLSWWLEDGHLLRGGPVVASGPAGAP